MARGKIIRYNEYTRIISVAANQTVGEEMIISLVAKTLTADPLFRIGYTVFHKIVASDIEIPEDCLPMKIISNRLKPR